MKVREVMTPNPISLPASANCRDAAKAMRDADIGAIVVENGKDVCGIVTDRDVVVRAIADGKDPKKVKLEDICTRDVTGLGPDDGLDRAMQMMRDRDIRRLVVVDGSKAVGIVSLGDLAQRLDRSSVLGDISSAPPNNLQAPLPLVAAQQRFPRPKGAVFQGLGVKSYARGRAGDQALRAPSWSSPPRRP
jgi:signal-transduction protein with cAMP-binding, CBS, and nucleotidyltransferase domain